MATFHKGQRVRLKPHEGDLEERGRIVFDEENGMWVVEVDLIYKNDSLDDRLRELSADQMEPLEENDV